MATASERRRQKLARDRARSEAVVAAAPTVVSLKPKRAEPPKETGLRWLLGKNKITRAMFDAGERYALGVRVASCGDAAAVKSSMAALECGRGGAGMTFRSRTPDELETAEWIAEYKKQTIFVRTKLFGDCELMAVLDSICIRQLTPREITPIQREAEDLEAVAWTVLKLLISILKAYDNPPQALNEAEACAA